jgi:hypothetical protein
VVLTNTLLFNAGGAAVAVLWTTMVCLLLGWGMLPGLFMSGAAAGILSFLWFIGSLGFFLQAGLSGVQRMTRGWMAAVGVVGLVGMIALGSWLVPWWTAIVAVAIGLGMTPLLSRVAQRVEGTKMTSWDLPAELIPYLQALPQRLPGEVEYLLDVAFRDWMHLRDLVGFTAESALKSYVDMPALSRDAQRTVLYLLRRAPVVAKLVDLAHERSDPQARKAAETAVRRLKAVGDVLHEAVTAASQFAASEERHEAHELKIRVDGLNELAASFEFDGLEIEADNARLEDPMRYRVSELMPEPQVRVPSSAPVHPEAVPVEVAADGTEDEGRGRAG